MGELAAGHSHINPVQSHWTAQRRKVRHRIGPRRSRDTKAEIQQAIPDRSCRQMVAESEDLEVVHFAERHVHRKRMPKIGIVSRVGSFVIRMHITGERLLFMCKVNDVRIRRECARDRGV